VAVVQDDKQHVLQHKAPRNLVIAVDASKTGEKLCRWTLDNIARAGDQLHALHVLPTMSRPHGLQSYAEALLAPLKTPSELELQEQQHRKHAKLEQRLHALMPKDGAQCSQLFGFPDS
jgi:nucleotide-binding universal stress UspA family protein